MKTELGCGLQDVGAGPNHRGGSEPPNFRSQIADCRLQARRAATGCRTATGACRKEEGTMQNEAAVAAEASARWLSAFLAVEWGNIRLCSLMFAYVRLLGEKCLRALREGKSRLIRAHPTKSDQIRPIINILPIPKSRWIKAN